MTNVIRMAYIDSELAKRRQGQDKAFSSANGYGSDGLAGPGMADLGIQRQPAALGKLHEIDLGPDATSRNIARTEAAKRRLEGGEEEIEEGTGKVRLRRDGKPWRGRRRRNSEDVKRDQLVEQVLRETRCECYPYYPSMSLGQQFPQWRYTTNQKPMLPTTTRRQTTALRSSSGGSLWTRSPRANSGRVLLQRLSRLRGRRWMIGPRARSWVGAGVLELR